jgi:hypothetical protein
MSTPVPEGVVALFDQLKLMLIDLDRRPSFQMVAGSGGMFIKWVARMVTQQSVRIKIESSEMERLLGCLRSATAYKLSAPDFGLSVDWYPAGGQYPVPHFDIMLKTELDKGEDCLCTWSSFSAEEARRMANYIEMSLSGGALHPFSAVADSGKMAAIGGC